MNLVIIGLLAFLFAVHLTLAKSYATSVFAKMKWNPVFWRPVAGALFILVLLLGFNLSHYNLFSHVFFKSFWVDYLINVGLWVIVFNLFYRKLLRWTPPAPAAPGVTKTSL